MGLSLSLDKGAEECIKTNTNPKSALLTVKGKAGLYFFVIASHSSSYDIWLDPGPTSISKICRWSKRKLQDIFQDTKQKSLLC